MRSTGPSQRAEPWGWGTHGPGGTPPASRPPTPRARTPTRTRAARSCADAPRSSRRSANALHWPVSKSRWGSRRRSRYYPAGLLMGRVRSDGVAQGLSVPREPPRAFYHFLYCGGPGASWAGAQASITAQRSAPQARGLLRKGGVPALTTQLRPFSVLSTEQAGPVLFSGLLPIRGLLVVPRHFPDQSGRTTLPNLLIRKGAMEESGTQNRTYTILSHF